MSRLAILMLLLLAVYMIALISVFLDAHEQEKIERQQREEWIKQREARARSPTTPSSHTHQKRR